MILRSFRISIAVRIIILTMTLVVGVYAWFESPLAASVAVVAILAVAQVVSLVRFLERTNTELARFLRSVRYDDFSQSFTSHGLGGTFEDLGEAFTGVMAKFRDTRAAAEEQHQYLQTVVQHIGIGLLAFDGRGDVALMNTAAKKSLGITSLRNVHSLDHISPEIRRAMMADQRGKREPVKFQRNNELIQLAVSSTQFRMREKQFTLVSLQNIRAELEEKEMEAYQKLIRVLTHEIMNSITPISSLASTVHDALTSGHHAGDGDRQEGSADDLREAVYTIKKRSDGLLRFVEAYRNLTRIPKPRFSIVSVADLLRQVEQLMRTQMPPDAVALTSHVDPQSLEVTADREQIEQVLLNLLVNALHAVRGVEQASIQLEGRLDPQGHVVIEVRDNGPGISEDVLDNMFIPFFTTKKEGSGIGLSLSKEILRLHKGTIHVSSQQGKGTAFRLVF